MLPLEKQSTWTRQPPGFRAAAAEEDKFCKRQRCSAVYRLYTSSAVLVVNCDLNRHNDIRGGKGADKVVVQCKCQWPFTDRDTTSSSSSTTTTTANNFWPPPWLSLPNLIKLWSVPVHVHVCVWHLSMCSDHTVCPHCQLRQCQHNRSLAH